MLFQFGMQIQMFQRNLLSASSGHEEALKPGNGGGRVLQNGDTYQTKIQGVMS
jgi:hypothetical protein